MSKFVLTAEYFTINGPAAPVTPTLSTATSGGTVLAGTYNVVISYVNASGETVGSLSASQITTGSTSTLTINSPNATAPYAGNATGWYAYVSSIAAPTVLTRQQTAGSPTALGTNLTLIAPPTTSGLTPLTVSTAGVDLTQWLSSAEIAVTVEDKDVTNYQSLGWHERLGGLKDGDVKITFMNDFAASAYDATIWPLLGTVVPFEARPTQGVRAATNPSFFGNILILAHSPIAGKVGDVDGASVTWKTSGIVERSGT